MQSKQIIGPNKQCEYHPCHVLLEDCTFCYCPFYPCFQKDTGGFEKINSRTGKLVWACSSCIFPHIFENAKKILEGLLELNANLDSITREELLALREKILNKKCD